ncbi:unnamed protein product [Owenia fusiformis]|uniref:Uncharacterized protein n=1 Tax=Owenia fusiformis TaxID=6347 RepID=A0A8J1T6D7_OWEFU|nr:unnamed protein product [Owenia fusiformis]
MAARKWIFLAFVLISGWSLEGVSGENMKCPDVCSCLGNAVDCSNKGKKELQAIPADIPNWATDLYLQGNDISFIPSNAFVGLTKLETINLQNNKILNVNSEVFKPAFNLKEINLSDNKLVAFPMFGQNAENLTKLYLNHNSISTIPPGALDGLKKLRELHVQYNNITKLSVGMFPAGLQMHHLSLSYNKINKTEPHALDNLTSLLWLKLNKNKISKLPEEFFIKLTKLKYLELNRNKFKELGGLTFKGLEKLKSLRLRRNKITKLNDGAFYGLSSIEQLHLDYNSITTISDKWLYGLETLTHFYLSHNLINKTDSNAWNFCKKLHELDLSHNKLTSFQEGAFDHLGALENLYLNHNKIYSIADGAFRGLTALEILEMNSNEISWTIEDMNGAFSGLKKLRQLGLDSNKIKSIAKRAFSGLEELKQLHLSDNSISSIQSNAFDPMKRLTDLRLNSTNLLCDCQLSWLPQWLDSSGFRESVNARCGHPNTLKGKSIFAVDATEFKCDDFPKPIIIEEPTSGIALKGGNLTLTCKAASSAETTIKFSWKKDNIPIPNANIETFATTNAQASTSAKDIIHYTTKLHLSKIEDNDSGKYQCVVSSTSFGPTYSSKAKIAVHVFPVFTKKPVDVTVKAGSTARLECAAKGSPGPEIAWQKDGGDDFPAARERRMHVMPEDDVFFIVEVKSSDEGTYSCTATNAAGSIIVNATLTVLETPSFFKPMPSEMHSKEGETTVLQCMASGSPKPMLTWQKDDKPLEVTPRHFFTTNNQLLVIVQTSPGDAGKYTCEMANTLGTSRDDTILRVLPTKSRPHVSAAGLDDESTTTGIIIIAVVCCVVGTSLVWVIIIYQTRKKPEEYSSTPTDETTLPGEMTTTTYGKSGRISPSILPQSHSTSSSHKNLSRSGSGSASGSSISGTESPYRFGSIAKPRTAAIFPSDVDDDDHRQSIPLTLDEQQTARVSDDSITALNQRLMPGNSDTMSSFQSHNSVQSCGPHLQTFHPYPTNHDRLPESPGDGPPAYFTLKQEQVHYNAPCRKNTSLSTAPHSHVYINSDNRSSHILGTPHTQNSQPPGTGEDCYTDISSATFPRKSPEQSQSSHSLHTPHRSHKAAEEPQASSNPTYHSSLSSLARRPLRSSETLSSPNSHSKPEHSHYQNVGISFTHQSRDSPFNYNTPEPPSMTSHHEQSRCQNELSKCDAL